MKRAGVPGLMCISAAKLAWLILHEADFGFKKLLARLQQFAKMGFKAGVFELWKKFG